MIALKEISKVICVCKYGVWRMGKALFHEGFSKKGTVDQREQKVQNP